MKTWYFAKCDKCKEVKTFFVNNVICTSHYLGEESKSNSIGEFFVRHYGCELTMGWRDDHLDQLWEEGYLNKDLE